ncbi:hypothetical protein [Pseudorhodoplanes sinuspersici]|uniref:Uncharacterized protein n=1 Tax=Pseudorhodoplanes sinuspersici TaxID=1235591 RepID=A0A1W6ZLW6_9HYPH|nr:hypothetical protein [Pseudorhodoplanes sinuspersici]ARP98413.1 hypothetical protein CAK95_04395 [Pseudorhodoplanes sinuspersici]RKE66082.1 hypothetical protein DFP91_5657 [Pseudorhodoplanes sinuspersici]
MALLVHSHVPVDRSEVPWALRAGAISGIGAGIVFAVFEMVASAAMMGAGASFMPLRMIGAILLGPGALDPSYSIWAAGAAGLIVHLALSVVYGAVFAMILGGLRSATWDVLLGAAFGFALWLINFYLIAPMAFPWFLDANPVIQFVAHTILFGAVLGWLMWRSRESATPIGEAGV